MKLLLPCKVQDNKIGEEIAVYISELANVNIIFDGKSLQMDCVEESKDCSTCDKCAVLAFEAGAKYMDLINSKVDIKSYNQGISDSLEVVQDLTEMYEVSKAQESVRVLKRSYAQVHDLIKQPE